MKCATCLIGFVPMFAIALSLPAIGSASTSPSSVCRVEPHKRTPGEISRVVHLYPPWSKDEFVVLRFPETVWVAGHGFLFMCNWPGLGPAAMPDDEPVTKWRRGADGSLSYERVMDGDRGAGGSAAGMKTLGAKVSGITYGGKLTPKADVVDIEFFIKNDTDKPFAVSADFCLICSRNGEFVIDETRVQNMAEGGEFADYKYERTFIHTRKGWLRLSEGDRGATDTSHNWAFDGRWCVYPVEGGPKLGEANPDAGVGTSSVAGDEAIVVVASSKDSRRMMAMSWPNPGSLMNNTRGPCIHCSPTFPQVPAHDKLTVKGKLYFFEGTLDELYKRYVADLGHLRDQQSRVK